MKETKIVNMSELGMLETERILNKIVKQSGLKLTNKFASSLVVGMCLESIIPKMDAVTKIQFRAQTEDEEKKNKDNAVDMLDSHFKTYSVLFVAVNYSVEEQNKWETGYFNTVMDKIMRIFINEITSTARNLSDIAEG